jgi:hypothetical protein
MPEPTPSGKTPLFPEARQGATPMIGGRRLARMGGELQYALPQCRRDQLHCQLGSAVAFVEDRVDLDDVE